MQLDKHFKEEYIEEINEGADKCNNPETHDEFAWDDVYKCQLAPGRVRESRMEEMECFQEMTVYNKKVSIQKCQDVAGRMQMC